MAKSAFFPLQPPRTKPQSYAKFAKYNILGALVWVLSFCGAGFFFGSQPWVQENFTVVVLAIIGLSGVPLAYEIMSARSEAEREAAAGGIHIQGGSASAGKAEEAAKWARYWGFSRPN